MTLPMDMGFKLGSEKTGDVSVRMRDSALARGSIIHSHTSSEKHPEFTDELAYFSDLIQKSISSHTLDRIPSLFKNLSVKKILRQIFAFLS